MLRESTVSGAGLWVRSGVAQPCLAWPQDAVLTRPLAPVRLAPLTPQPPAGGTATPDPAPVCRPGRLLNLVALGSASGLPGRGRGPGHRGA